MTDLNTMITKHRILELLDYVKDMEHPNDIVQNWLRNRGTVEFLGIWERLNNPDFNPVEFDGIRIQTGLNSFVLTPSSTRLLYGGKSKKP